jgi:N-acetylmuramoyl-L-alanine amidase
MKGFHAAACFLAVCFAQTAAAQSLVVTGPSETVRIPTIATASGPMIDVEALGRMIPIRLTRDSASWYSIEAWGGKLQLEAGSKIAVVDGNARPLVAAPVARNRTLLVPMQVVSEVFPAALPNMKWEADSNRLKLFTSVAGKASSVSVRQSGDAGEVIPRFIPPKGGKLPPVQVKNAGRHMVIVDAGHGGVDNGMSGPIGRGPKIYEKNITLAVSRRLGKQLESRGVDVVYTRTADTLIALDDRGRMANRAQGDLFISIHVNAANPNWKDPGGSRGFETYFLSEARTEDARRVEQMENDAARFETVTSKIDKDDPLSFILSDMQQNEHLRESSELADMIQKRLGTMHPGPSRGVKQAGFRVLVTAYMPAVLVEIGFGTNPKDAQFIGDPAKQEALAAAIADAAMDYLDCYDNRVKSQRSNACASGRTGSSGTSGARR